MEQKDRRIKNKNALEVPNTVYQRLVRMLITSAFKEEKQGKRAKKVNTSRGA